MANKFLIGVLQSEESLLAMCRAARARNFGVHDAYTPFAVHGLDEAMGLKPTRLGQVCFVLGLTGLSLALGFQLWVSVWDWPLNIGGKSYAALPALIPVAFEVTILFAALGTVLTIFVRASLWPGKSVSLVSKGITDDRFVLMLKCSDEELDAARALLGEHGSSEIRVQEVDE